MAVDMTRADGKDNTEPKREPKPGVAPRDKEPMLSYSIHVLFIILAIALGGGAYGYFGKELTSEDWWAQAVVGRGGVATVHLLEWEPALMKEAMRNNTPVVFANTPASDWAAMQKWTLGYLANSLNDLDIVQVSPNPNQSTYTYEVKNAPLESILRKEEFDSGYTGQSMNARDFFVGIINQTDDRWLYYQGGLAQSDGKKSHVLLDLGDPDEFGLKQAAKATGRGPDDVEEKIYVWMGKPGVKANGRFDHVHGLHVQITGYKRYLLFPPSLHEILAPYPFLHPRQGQTSLDLESPAFQDSSISPEDMQKIRESMMYVVLEPGDVLYVPPLWTHHVTCYDSAMGPPITVSIWHRASTGLATEMLSKISIPVSDKWPLYLRWSGAYSFTYHVLSFFNEDGTDSLCASRMRRGEAPALGEECLKTAAQLFLRARARYKSIAPWGEQATPAAPEHGYEYQCRAHMGEGYFVVGPKPNGYEEFLTFEVENLREARDKAMQVADILKPLTPEERLVVAFDFIESVMVAAVGINGLYDSLAAFPAHCPPKNLTKTHAIPPSA